MSAERSTITAPEQRRRVGALFDKVRNGSRTVREYLDPESDWHPRNPPLTPEQVLRRRHHMARKANLREATFNGMREVTTVPSSGEHYDGNTFKWDRLAAIGDNALHDDIALAVAELRTGERVRDPKTGFMTNKARIKGAESGYKAVWPENKVQIIEGKNPYSQASLEGWAVLKTYDAYQRKIARTKETGQEEQGQQLKQEATAFLEEMYGVTEVPLPTTDPDILPDSRPYFTGLRGECEYWIRQCQTSETDPLTFLTHVNGSGRDYDRALGGPKNIDVPGKGKVATAINTGTRWAQMQVFNSRLARIGRPEEDQTKLLEADQRSDWIPEKVREKYATNDVMMNAFHTVNLRNTATIARTLAELSPEKASAYIKDATRYESIADQVEDAILSRMWHEKDSIDPIDTKETFFYNLDKEGNQINVKSITGLFPLLLKNIPQDKLTLLLDRLEDPQWFGTNYPIPSHPVCSEFYDPHYRRKEGPNWMGPVWGITNYFLREEGLARQAERFLASTDHEERAIGERCLRIAQHIAETDQQLLSINEKTREQYDPETGQGQRVKDFMWSNLMLHAENTQEVQQKYSLAA